MSNIHKKLELLNFNQEEIIDFTKNLSNLTYIDRQRLVSRINKQNIHSKNIEDNKLELLLCMSEGMQRLAQLKATIPTNLNYSTSLPITQKRSEIVEAIKKNQVIVLAGETGSGKTTQLPKMCLEAGLGVYGMIGHTQPRRIAARSVASRIAQELDDAQMQNVGSKVRFNDNTGPLCKIKLMTDGILLSEIANDRLLLKYDCIIIDEAHERSLNIDFLLGYMKYILKKRPELKLIITSATIDLKRFSKHFDDAPIIEVEGRTYPVEVVYMPLVQEYDEDGERIIEELDLNKGILQAIKYLMQIQRADILVFLPGEREIAALMTFLQKQHLADVEILPLYARLAYSEQSKIFKEHQNMRIVLATNVAETSITVPSIKYVIDVGLARISRYSTRTKIQRLPIEAISQSSANQRKGRCGRVSSGICVRLYDEADFESRPLYTDAQILRSNLAAVILQMVSMKLGDIKSFPFIDRPQDKQINDGLRLLYEIGAIKTGRDFDTNNIELTAIGVQLAKIPTDPRLSRMILEGARRFCLNEILIIASALAVSDPRENPLDKREAANNAHAKFKDERSDFLSYIKLFKYLQDKQESLSKRAFINELKTQFISYLRVKEWFDLHLQLKLICKSLNFKFNEQDSDYESIHKALLSGLLMHMGMQTNEPFVYKGSNNIKFAIFPNSALFKKKVKWLMANEISQTSKLYARTVAKIEPQWAYDFALHLVKKQYSDVFFSKDKGCACAYMTVNLYSLPIISKQKVLYNKIDPIVSRELFIKEGLVHGNLNCKHKFFIQNLELIADIESLEHKVRNKDLIVDEAVLFDFYDRQIPSYVSCYYDFDKWYKQASKEHANLLCFSFEDVTKDKINSIQENLFPDFYQVGDLKLKLSYIFDPTDDKDGVSVHIPISVLNQVEPKDFLNIVPGLQDEFFTALIKSLPKRLRRNLIPAPNYAQALKEYLQDMNGDLLVNAAKGLTRIGGELIKISDFDLSQIDKHLFMTFIIEDMQGKTISYSKNLQTLIDTLQDKVNATLNSVINSKNKQANTKTYTQWSFDDIKPVQTIKKGSMEIVAYPALNDVGDAVELSVFDSKYKQAVAMQKGTRKLIYLSIKSPNAYLQEHLPNRAKLSMYYKELGSVYELIDDLCLCAIDTIVEQEGGYSYTKEGFIRLLNKVKANLNETALNIAKILEQILLLAHDIKKLLQGNIPLNLALMYKDCKYNLSCLIYKGFIVDTKFEHLEDLPRYLQTIVYRLQKAPLDINRDLTYQRKLDEVLTYYSKAKTKAANNIAILEALEQVKWQIQELRVSYFAQSKGVKGQVSEKRIMSQIDNILEQ